MDFNSSRQGISQIPPAGMGMDGSSVLSLNKIGETDDKKLTILAKEFEAILLGQMLKTMRSTIDDSGFIKKGEGEELFTEMLDGEFARQMAFTQSDGLADSLVEQLMIKSTHKKGDGDTEDNESAPVNSSEGKASKTR